MAPPKSERISVNKLLSIGFQRLRKRIGVSQEKLGEPAKASQKTVSNWEGVSSNTIKFKPSAEQILQILTGHGVGFDDLVDAAIAQLSETSTIDFSSSKYKKAVETLKAYGSSRQVNPDNQLDESYDSHETHFQMLKYFASMEYRCYFMHTSIDNKLTSLSIKTGEIDRKGFLPFDMSVEEYGNYVGKIIAPVNVKYVYFYFNKKKDEAFKERGLITAHFPIGISEPYLGGVGIMQSLSRNSHINTLQRVVILPADLNIKRKKEGLIKLLEMPLIEAKYHYVANEIVKDHEECYNLFLKGYRRKMK